MLLHTYLKCEIFQKTSTSLFSFSPLPVMEKHRLYTLDEFLLKLQPSQRYTRIIYLDFRRENQNKPFRFESLRLLYAALTLLIVDCACNVLKIIFEIRAQRLSEAKQIGAVWSIEFLCLIRGIFVMFKHKSMLDLTNDLDKIFPRTRLLQNRMNCHKLARYLLIRHRFLFAYAVVGLSAFIGIPLLKYIVFYDPNSGEPLLDEYHQHASWFPFHLKENPTTYPYMYVSETILTLFGINCLFTWDHIYTVTVAQFIMHFEYVNTELARLNAKDTMDVEKSKKFYDDLVEIIKYHQHVLR